MTSRILDLASYYSQNRVVMKCPIRNHFMDECFKGPECFMMYVKQMRSRVKAMMCLTFCCWIPACPGPWVAV